MISDTIAALTLMGALYASLWLPEVASKPFCLTDTQCAALFPEIDQ